MSWLHFNSPSLDEAVRYVTTYLENVRQRYPLPHKLAIVFDIDDTVLLDNGAGKRQRALVAMKNLFSRARRLNYGIFFITARPDTRNISNPNVRENYNFTKTQLKRTGFGDFNDLFLMPPELRAAHEFSTFKRLMRHKIEEDGWTIVLNCGDSYHDLMALPEASSDKRAATILKRLKSLPAENYVLFTPVVEKVWCALKMISR